MKEHEGIAIASVNDVDRLTVDFEQRHRRGSLGGAGVGYLSAVPDDNIVRRTGTQEFAR